MMHAAPPGNWQPPPAPPCVACLFYRISEGRYRHPFLESITILGVPTPERQARALTCFCWYQGLHLPAYPYPDPIDWPRLPAVCRVMAVHRLPPHRRRGRRCHRRCRRLNRGAPASSCCATAWRAHWWARAPVRAPWGSGPSHWGAARLAARRRVPALAAPQTTEAGYPPALGPRYPSPSRPLPVAPPSLFLPPPPPPPLPLPRPTPSA
mmetsp:Transcript_16394/g.42001  ORF Transcript_16394/g.42001 Transcript_16394/m.42001 type:complete len:209 (-) Transcript_16394:197-823(-)